MIGSDDGNLFLGGVLWDVAMNEIHSPILGVYLKIQTLIKAPLMSCQINDQGKSETSYG